MPTILFYTDAQFKRRLGHIAKREATAKIFEQYHLGNLLELATKHQGEINLSSLQTTIDLVVGNFQTKSAKLGNPKAKQNARALKALLESPQAGISRDFAPVEVLREKSNPALFPSMVHALSSFIPTPTKDKNLISRRTGIVFCWDLCTPNQEKAAYVYNSNGERISVSSEFHKALKGVFRNFIEDLNIEDKNRIVGLMRPNEDHKEQVKAVQTEMLRKFHEHPSVKALSDEFDDIDIKSLVPHSYYILRERFKNSNGQPELVSRKLCFVSNTDDIVPRRHLVLELAQAVQAHKSAPTTSNLDKIKYYVYLLYGLAQSQADNYLNAQDKNNLIICLNYYSKLEITQGDKRCVESLVKTIFHADLNNALSTEAITQLTTQIQYKTISSDKDTLSNNINTIAIALGFIAKFNHKLIEPFYRNNRGFRNTLNLLMIYYCENTNLQNPNKLILENEFLKGMRDQIQTKRLERLLDALNRLHKLHRLNFGLIADHNHAHYLGMKNVANEIETLDKNVLQTYFENNPGSKLQLKKDYAYYRNLRAVVPSGGEIIEHSFAKTFNAETGNERQLENQLKELAAALNKGDITDEAIENKFNEIIKHTHFKNYVRAEPSFRAALVKQYDTFKSHLNISARNKLKAKPNFKLMEVISAKDKAIQLLKQSRKKWLFQTEDNRTNLKAAEDDINLAEDLEKITTRLSQITYQARGGFFAIANKFKSNVETRTGKNIAALINRLGGNN